MRTELMIRLGSVRSTKAPEDNVSCRPLADSNRAGVTFDSRTGKISDSRFALTRSNETSFAPMLLEIVVMMARDKGVASCRAAFTKQPA